MRAQAISLVAGLLLAMPGHAQAPAADTPKDRQQGAYEGIAASENAVWVIDTRTGRVRKCTQDFADQTPACSDWSKY